MSLAVLGALVGLLLGTGAGLLVDALAPERPGLEARVLAYVPDVALAIGVTPSAPSSAAWRGSLARRLDRAGLSRTVAEHRTERLRWGSIALTAAATGWLLLGLDPARDAGWLVMVTGGAFGSGVLAQELWVTAAARRRQRAMTAGLPAVAERIAWAVWAGLPLDVALASATDGGSGPLAAELSRVDVLRADGLGLSAALRVVAEGAVPLEIERYLVSLGIALERGSPVSDVAVAQAAELLNARRSARSGGVVVAGLLALAVAGVSLASSGLVLGWIALPG